MRSPLQAAGRWLNIGFVACAAIAYLGLTFFAPHSDTPSPYHISIAVTIILATSIVGLWIATCFFGLLAWLRLSDYALLLPAGSSRGAYQRMAQGVRILAYGLLVSSILGACGPYFQHNVEVGAIFSEANYFLILIVPFIGFWYLRSGSRSLAVSAHAMMSVRVKLATVGPPVLVLAAFYVFLAGTSSSPINQLADGPWGFLMLPFNFLLVIGSWVLGLLAALNVERATHRGNSEVTQPLVKLYNGMLTMTGGFIILDAILSLGTVRLASLPVGLLVVLLYAFIAVIGLGFVQVAMSAKAHLAAAKRDG